MKSASKFLILSFLLSTSVFAQEEDGLSRLLNARKASSAPREFKQAVSPLVLKAQPVEQDPSSEAVEQVESTHAIPGYENTESALHPIEQLKGDYLSNANGLRDRDVNPVDFSDAKVAVHLFPLGPNGETFWPQLKMRDSESCSGQHSLEFSTLVERDEGGAQFISSVGLHTGAAYGTRYQSGNDRFSITEPIFGQVAPYALERGKFTKAYSDPRVGDLYSAGRLAITAEPVGGAPTHLRYTIKTRSSRGEWKTHSRTIDLDQSDGVVFPDPDSGANIKAGVMGNSVHFALRSKPLIESNRYSVMAPTGTAFHAGDYNHVRCGNSRSGSCARLQSEHSAKVYAATAGLFESHGGVVSSGGVATVSERDERREGGLYQNLVQSEGNFNNLRAMLEMRSETAFDSFMAATPNSLLRPYKSQMAQLREKQSRAISSGALSDLEQSRSSLVDQINSYERSIRRIESRPIISFSKRKREQAQAEKRAEITPLQSRLSALQLQLQEVNAKLANPEENALEESDQQKMSRLASYISRTQFRFSNQDMDTSTHPMPPSVRDFYGDKKNKKALYEGIAKALKEHYGAIHGTDIPAGCMESVREYEHLAASIK